MLVESRDHNGKVLVFNSDQVVSMKEAGTSSQWHGIKTLIKLTDGQTLECAENITELSSKMGGGPTLLNG